ncbi:hypothetical protein U0070_009414 [Myodes glareolus]|uniref:Uncharacterized protein n=1 Tax=Myodes glareolus TaxID=447135 RepID=A0AAW0I0S2_MYOGA
MEREITDSESGLGVKLIISESPTRSQWEQAYEQAENVEKKRRRRKRRRKKRRKKRKEEEEEEEEEERGGGGGDPLPGLKWEP